MAGVLPLLAYMIGRWCVELAGSRAVVLAAALAVVNWAAWGALRAAALAAAPAEPAQTVSGMMRARLRDVGPRSDLARFAAELARGPEGYVEAVASVIKAKGGGTAFSDADALSLMVAAGVKPVYENELASARPDWILPSPWLRLTPEVAARVAALAAGGGYEAVPVEAPLLLWQNNPDPLFRDFAPRTGVLPLLRRK